MTIEEKAKKLYYVPKHLECKEAHDEVQLQREAFIQGAEWMLFQVKNWLKENIENYAYFDFESSCDVNTFTEDLKKAMEE